MSERIGAEHYGEERAETAEALAELIIAEELERGRWQEADLKTRPEGGFSEGGFGGALAGGDDDDGGVDRRTCGDGHARLSEPSLVSPEETGRGVNNIKNCLFLTLFLDPFSTLSLWSASSSIPLAQGLRLWLVAR